MGAFSLLFLGPMKTFLTKLIVLKMLKKCSSEIMGFNR